MLGRGRHKLQFSEPNKSQFHKFTQLLKGDQKQSREDHQLRKFNALMGSLRL